MRDDEEEKEEEKERKGEKEELVAEENIEEWLNLVSRVLATPTLHDGRLYVVTSHVGKKERRNSKKGENNKNRRRRKEETWVNL